MLRYQNLLAEVYNTPHLIRPEKLEAIRRVVTDRAMGLHVDAAAIQEMVAARGDRQSQVTRSVAVLPIVGTLAKRMDLLEESSGGTSTDRIGREFDQLMADDSVGAIVLDIDSPGGSTFGVQELAAKIKAARGRKPIRAVANPEAASAAYWIATAADKVAVTPSGWVGSVGAMTIHTDLSVLNEQLGMKVSYIYAGEYKVEGNADEPLSDDAREYYQAMVNEVYDQFVTALAIQRETTKADVRANYGRGRMLLAEDAKRAGMVDKIATLEEVIAELAGNGPSKANKMRSARVGLEKARYRA
jgi:signal peptide peptidase SppA